MNTLNIAICEDNRLELTYLLDLIKANDIPTTCTTFSSGEEFLKNYEIGMFDLIYMDIYMKGITGIETVKAIRTIDPDVLVAFTTTSLDYTLESYRLDATKYLEKPASQKAVNDLLELASLKAKSKPCFTFKQDGNPVSIPFCHIVYLEQQGHTLIIYATNNRIFQTNNKLDKIEYLFEQQSFIRCHKSYLVNLNFIKSLNKDLSVFEMQEGGNVHIRRESMSLAKNAYEEILLNKGRECNYKKE